MCSAYIILILMGFLRPKKRGKSKYWYYVESSRTSKQKQIYLGTANSILRKIKKKKK